MNKLKIYIASPYIAGNLSANIERQMATASLLIEVGCNPYVPLFNHFIQARWKKTDDIWLNLDLDWLSTCDAVYRLTGYCERTEKEVEYAKSKNIPILYSMKDVLDFIHERKKMGKPKKGEIPK